MAAGKFDLNIDMGATFTRVLTWTAGSPPAAVNLTGYTAHAQLRDGTGDLILDLTVGSGLALGGSAGTITLTITAAQTTALTDPLTWDLKLTAGDGTATRLLEGAVFPSPQVTQ